MSMTYLGAKVLPDTHNNHQEKRKRNPMGLSEVPQDASWSWSRPRPAVPEHLLPTEQLPPPDTCHLLSTCRSLTPAAP